MRVCLINAPTGTEYADPGEFNSKLIRAATIEPQLGILNLAAVVERSCGTPSVYDLNRSFFRFADEVGEQGIHQFAEHAASQIAATNARVYGFGSICSGYPLTLRIARIVKAMQPDSVILLGGPQATVVSEETLAAFPFVDFVLRGEAEHSLPMLIEEIVSNRNFTRVPGLTHRSAFGIQRNPDAPLIQDLDALPSPAYHLTGELREMHYASLELGRGCPFACTFCSTNDFFRRKFRLRRPERILAEMRAIETEYGIRDFSLVHDMFTVDAKRVAAFCHAMIDSGEGYTWSCSARTDCVDEPMIELMAAAGCNAMFFGVETGSERMQKIIDKHLDTRRAHQMIDIAERYGVGTTISLITGFPEETEDDLKGTLRMFMHSARTPGSKPQLGLLAPLAKTPIHTQYRDRLTLQPLSSSMSNQSRRQHPADMELIERYQNIFPNFYLLPNPHFEPNFLMGLNEFMSMATARFSWLLCAVDHAAGDLLQLFKEWAGYLQRLHPGLAGSGMRFYYQTPRFRLEFFAFLQQHPVGADPLVKLFMEFDQALAGSPDYDAVAPPGSVLVSQEKALNWSDIPLRTDKSAVVQIQGGELGEAMTVLRQSLKPDLKPGPYYYAVPQLDGRKNPVYQISQRMACTLAACDGQRTLRALFDALAVQMPDLSVERRNYTVLTLVKAAVSDGLLAIYRKAELAEDNHDAGFGHSEYKEMSADASLENQSPIQAQ